MDPANRYTRRHKCVYPFVPLLALLWPAFLALTMLLGWSDFRFEPALRELGAIVAAPDALGGGDWTTSQNEDAVLWLTRAIMNSYAVIVGVFQTRFRLAQGSLELIATVPRDWYLVRGISGF